MFLGVNTLTLLWLALAAKPVTASADVMLLFAPFAVAACKMWQYTYRGTLTNSMHVLA